MPKFELIKTRALDELRPAPVNADIYDAIATDTPEIHSLARSIKERGVLDPIWISTDNVMISGHRRHIAARIAGLERVPVRVYPIKSSDPDFPKILVELNDQRIKSAETLMREAVVRIDPQAARETLANEREAKIMWSAHGHGLQPIESDDDGRRAIMSDAKMPLLNAVIRILNEQIKYWPLTVRQIHYRLLGPNAPLKHAGKPDSIYRNDEISYGHCIDVCARGRIEGYIPWHCINDETRPVRLNNAFGNLNTFFQQELKGFLGGYWRNLLQSQPNHIELVTEKLTLQEFLAPVARDHTMPLTVIRGMSSLPPKKAIADRFKASNKAQLVLLIVTDLDPAGETIARDMLKSMRRDFGIDDIEAIKVALTMDQVQDYGLNRQWKPRKAQAIKSSSPITARMLTSWTPCNRQT